MLTALGLSALLIVIAAPGFKCLLDSREVENKPKVLIIGDSISIAYAPVVYGLLSQHANVVRPLDEKGSDLNCEGTTRGVTMVEQWLGTEEWDVIHFNFGLHDLKHVHRITGKNSRNPVDPQQANLTQYESQLKAIVAKLKATNAKLIFATTTPYRDRPDGPLRRADQVAKYNQVALDIMKDNEVEINDLHAFVSPRMNELLLPRNVHFRVAGSRALAHRVAAAISNAL